MTEEESQFTIARANFKRAKAEMELLHGKAAGGWDVDSAVQMACFYHRWCMRFYDLAHDDHLKKNNVKNLPGLQ